MALLDGSAFEQTGLMAPFLFHGSEDLSSDNFLHSARVVTVDQQEAGKGDHIFLSPPVSYVSVVALAKSDENQIQLAPESVVSRESGTSHTIDIAYP